jgi:hypothetical protein
MIPAPRKNLLGCLAVFETTGQQRVRVVLPSGSIGSLGGLALLGKTVNL